MSETWGEPRIKPVLKAIQNLEAIQGAQKLVPLEETTFEKAWREHFEKLEKVEIDTSLEGEPQPIIVEPK